jgi:hypothetical protein
LSTGPSSKTRFAALQHSVWGLGLFPLGKKIDLAPLPGGISRHRDLRRRWAALC